MLCLLCLLLPEWGQAQILDDSSTLRYSDRTVRFRTEAEWIENRGGHVPDSGLANFSEKGDFLVQGRNFFQNLGVFGSASRPLFYALPQTIGLRNGMQAFDALLPSAQQIRYYRTLSPYSSIFYNQGSRRRSLIRGTFSVNLKPRLNLTGEYQRFTAMRVLNVTSAEQRQNDHHSAWVSANYADSLDRFRIWGFYQHLNHLQYETGGADLARIPNTDSLFSNSDIMPVRLSDQARNREIRNQIYLAQMTRLGKSNLWVRSWHSRRRQNNFFNDPLPRLSFYGSNRLYFQKKDPGASSDTLYSERRFETLENGLRLMAGDSVFQIEGGIRYLHNRYVQNIQTLQRVPHDWLPGVKANWRPAKNWQILAEGEYRDANEWQMSTVLSGAGLEISGRILRFRPSVIQQFFLSKNLLYENRFTPTFASQVKVRKHWKFKGWHLQPAVELVSVREGIFFDTSFAPVQTEGTTFIQHFRLDFGGPVLSRLHTQNTFIRTFQSGPVISGMPGFLYRSAHWFDLVRNRKAYAVQIGFNLDWRFDWKSEEFNPLTSQWGVQNTQTIPPYFLFDAFAHIRIDRARLYFKVHNTLQGLGSAGYFAAPGLPGQRRLFEFGLNWTFFD